MKSLLIIISCLSFSHWAQASEHLQVIELENIQLPTGASIKTEGSRTYVNFPETDSYDLSFKVKVNQPGSYKFFSSYRFNGLRIRRGYFTSTEGRTLHSRRSYYGFYHTHMSHSSYPFPWERRSEEFTFTQEDIDENGEVEIHLTLKSALEGSLDIDRFYLVTPPFEQESTPVHVLSVEDVIPNIQGIDDLESEDVTYNIKSSEERTFFDFDFEKNGQAKVRMRTVNIPSGEYKVFALISADSKLVGESFSITIGEVTKSINFPTSNQWESVSTSFYIDEASPEIFVTGPANSWKLSQISLVPLDHLDHVNPTPLVEQVNIASDKQLVDFKLMNIGPDSLFCKSIILRAFVASSSDCETSNASSKQYIVRDKEILPFESTNFKSIFKPELDWMNAFTSEYNRKEICSAAVSQYDCGTPCDSANGRQQYGSKWWKNISHGKLKEICTQGGIIQDQGAIECDIGYVPSGDHKQCLPAPCGGHAHGSQWSVTAGSRIATMKCHLGNISEASFRCASDSSKVGNHCKSKCGIDVHGSTRFGQQLHSHNMHVGYLVERCDNGHWLPDHASCHVRHGFKPAGYTCVPRDCSNGMKHGDEPKFFVYNSWLSNHELNLNCHYRRIMCQYGVVYTHYKVWSKLSFRLDGFVRKRTKCTEDEAKNMPEWFPVR